MHHVTMSPSSAQERSSRLTALTPSLSTSCRYEHGTPAAFWLPGFFFTPSFTTAALQNYARARNLAIDSVGFDFQMIPGDPTALHAAPSEGVYIYGMYLEGCAWDSGLQELCESRPKVLTEPAPVVWLKPMQTTQFSKFPHFSCPGYRTAERKGAQQPLSQLLTYQLPPKCTCGYAAAILLSVYTRRRSITACKVLICARL